MSDKFQQAAFPTYERQQSHGIDMGLDLTGSGMTLRDYFAIRAPYPTTDQINKEMNRDTNLKPHDDPHKPQLRTKLEVITDLAYEYADSMMISRNKKDK